MRNIVASIAVVILMSGCTMTPTTWRARIGAEIGADEPEPKQKPQPQAQPVRRVVISPRN